MAQVFRRNQSRSIERFIDCGYCSCTIRYYDSEIIDSEDDGNKDSEHDYIICPECSSHILIK